MKDDVTSGSSGTSKLAQRAGILFLNFFLIILAYYQVKSSSRSIFIEYWGADRFPVVWIVSPLVLLAIIGFYHRLVERHRRLHVVLGSLALFMALLLGFRVLLAFESAPAAFGFYVLVDILSVILVEQFWSLANTVNDTEEGRRSYWFVGTGGLLGGGIGGWFAARLLDWTPLTTPDLLVSCAVLLGVTFALNLYIARLGLYREVETEGEPLVSHAGGWRALLKSRYLVLIAAALLCAQLVQPIVEFQWAKMIEATYTELDARTRFYGDFFFVFSLISIGINLSVTPLVHRYLGVIAGMTAQPLLLTLSSFAFMASSTLWVACAMKVSDRGLSYSINRASKEVLYIPVDPVHTYQAKAWIDILGYRLFKILGSGLILLFTQAPFALGVAELGWLTLAVCAAWVCVIALLAREYGVVSAQPVTA